MHKCYFMSFLRRKIEIWINFGATLRKIEWHFCRLSFGDSIGVKRKTLLARISIVTKASAMPKPQSPAIRLRRWSFCFVCAAAGRAPIAEKRRIWLFLTRRIDWKLCAKSIAAERKRPTSSAPIFCAIRSQIVDDWTKKFTRFKTGEKLC